MKEIKLINPMYPCQDIPMVVFEQLCPVPCLYCSLREKVFSQGEIITYGVDNVILTLKNYKSAYFSPTTDCFLPENSDLTHYVIEEVWKINPLFVPLIVTKQIIPDKTIVMFTENKQRLVLQVSIPWVNQSIVSLLEPGSALISDRLKMIKRLTLLGISVIAVVMPYFGCDNPDIFAKNLADAGIKRTIVSTAVLDINIRNKMLCHHDSKIQQIVIPYTEEVGHGFVLPFDQKVKLLKDLSNSIQNFGIKARICTYDHPDLVGFGFDLCKNFKHKNFK